MRVEFPPFPNSKIDPFHITSPETPTYNCIAWAYEDESRWYWPDKIYYWPEDIPVEETMKSFLLLFEKIGYQICEKGDLEIDFQKIALYSDQHGSPKHAARQLENGFWTSKLGGSFDVTHTIFSMSDGHYGNAVIFMKRRCSQ